MWIYLIIAMNKKGGILCHEEMEQVLRDKDQEQVEERGWEEGTVEEAGWEAIDRVQLPAETVYAPIAAREWLTKQVSLVMR